MNRSWLVWFTQSFLLCIYIYIYKHVKVNCSKECLALGTKRHQKIATQKYLALGTTIIQEQQQQQQQQQQWQHLPWTAPLWTWFPEWCEVQKLVVSCTSEGCCRLKRRSLKKQSRWFHDWKHISAWYTLVSHRIHVWFIYLHLDLFVGKCRSRYTIYTWILCGCMYMYFLRKCILYIYIIYIYIIYLSFYCWCCLLFSNRFRFSRCALPTSSSRFQPHKLPLGHRVWCHMSSPNERVETAGKWN